MNQIQEILIRLNTEYKKYISNLKKDDLKELNLRKIKKLRLYGIFSSYYYKRNNLLKKGNITTGYLYKIFNDTGKNGVSIGYVLHSPMLEFLDGEIYKNDIYPTITRFLEGKSDYKNNKLKNILTNNVAELHYFLIPKELIGYDDVYISTIPILSSEEIYLGLNYFIVNLSVSKEILLVRKDLKERLFAQINNKNNKN